MNQKEEIKFSNSNILEGMTSISALLNSEAENDRRIERVLIDASKRRSKAAEIGFLVAKSHELGFPVEFVDTEEIDRLSVGNTHGGILALCTARTIPTLTAKDIRPDSFYVYLEGIEDPYNFGYAIRSLYAAGVSGIVLPPRNWMSAAGVVARASAGASESLPIFEAEGEDAVKLFREVGYSILCAGIRDSVSIFDEEFPYPVLLVVGGEKRGISRALLDAADRIVRIDYGRDFSGSLSAASAATVLAFEIFRQNRK
jgi:23S rRNA (guanosine2251-2'-O)-methyltransferase